MFVLVLWLSEEPHTTSVLPLASIKREGENRTSAKWASKYYPVKILREDDDENWLNSLEVGIDGQVWTPQNRKKVPDTIFLEKRAIRNEEREASTSAARVKRFSDAALVHQPSIFDDDDDSHGDSDDEREATNFNESDGDSEGESSSKKNDMEESIDDSESDSIADGEHARQESRETANEEHARQESRGTSHQTTSCKTCAAFPKVTPEIIHQQELFLQHLKMRLGQQLASSPDESQAAVSGTEILEVLPSSLEPGKGKRELVENSGIWIKNLDFDHYTKKYRKNPKEMTRRFLRCIIGRENLSKMTRTGKTLKPIPAVVYNAVQEIVYEYTKTSLRLSTETFERCVTQMCNTIRTTDKKKKNKEKQNTASGDLKAKDNTRAALVELSDGNDVDLRAQEEQPRKEQEKHEKEPHLRKKRFQRMSSTSEYEKTVQKIDEKKRRKHEKEAIEKEQEQAQLDIERTRAIEVEREELARKEQEENEREAEEMKRVLERKHQEKLRMDRDKLETERTEALELERQELVKKGREEKEKAVEEMRNALEREYEEKLRQEREKLELEEKKALEFERQELVRTQREKNKREEEEMRGMLEREYQEKLRNEQEKLELERRTALEFERQELTRTEREKNESGAEEMRNMREREYQGNLRNEQEKQELERTKALEFERQELTRTERERNEREEMRSRRDESEHREKLRKEREKLEMERVKSVEIEHRELDSIEREKSKRNAEVSRDTLETKYQEKIRKERGKFETERCLSKMQQDLDSRENEKIDSIREKTRKVYDEEHHGEARNSWKSNEKEREKSREIHVTKSREDTQRAGQTKMSHCESRRNSLKIGEEKAKLRNTSERQREDTRYKRSNFSDERGREKEKIDRTKKKRAIDDEEAQRRSKRQKNSNKDKYEMSTRSKK